MKVGEVICAPGSIEINAGRETREVEVSNLGDRPVQVGSHAHFFEVNRCLSFDRSAAFGMRLDIPSGTSVRFEPGETRNVRLCAIGGSRRVFGLNGLTQGPIDRAGARDKALAAAEWRGFTKYEEGVSIGFDGAHYRLGGSANVGSPASRGEKEGE